MLKALKSRPVMTVCEAKVRAEWRAVNGIIRGNQWNIIMPASTIVTTLSLLPWVKNFLHLARNITILYSAQKCSAAANLKASVLVLLTRLWVFGWNMENMEGQKQNRKIKTGRTNCSPAVKYMFIARYGTDRRDVCRDFAVQQPQAEVNYIILLLSDTHWPTACRAPHTDVCVCRADVSYLLKAFPVLLLTHAPFPKTLEGASWRTITVAVAGMCVITSDKQWGHCGVLWCCGVTSTAQKPLKFSRFHLWPHFVFQK